MSLKIQAGGTETLAALTYSMANRCEVIIAADGDATKYQIVLVLTLKVINPINILTNFCGKPCRRCGHFQPPSLLLHPEAPY